MTKKCGVHLAGIDDAGGFPGRFRPSGNESAFLRSGVPAIGAMYGGTVQEMTCTASCRSGQRTAADIVEVLTADRMGLPQMSCLACPVTVLLQFSQGLRYPLQGDR